MGQANVVEVRRESLLTYLKFDTATTRAPTVRSAAPRAVALLLEPAYKLGAARLRVGRSHECVYDVGSGADGVN